MGEKTHEYRAHTTWTGNNGTGTSSYDVYGRGYDFQVEGKPVISGSADQMFRGDPNLYNPEDLFLAALSACHLLSYLALCARKGVRVLAYEDAVSGTLSRPWCRAAARTRRGRRRSCSTPTPRCIACSRASIARCLARSSA